MKLVVNVNISFDFQELQGNKFFIDYWFYYQFVTLHRLLFVA